jgi:hypothetical protein
MLRERGDDNERCENCQSFNSSNLLRLTKRQKIVTLPDIVTEQFDDIARQIGTDPDYNDVIPRQCWDCPQYQEIRDAIELLETARKALANTGFRANQEDITEYLQAHGKAKDEIDDVLKNSEQTEKIRSEMQKELAAKYNYYSDILDILCSRQSVQENDDCPGPVECTSEDKTIVVKVCGSPTIPDGENYEVTAVDRTSRGNQNLSESDTSEQ